MAIAYPLLSKLQGERILAADILPYQNNIKAITNRFNIVQYRMKIRWQSFGIHVSEDVLLEIREQFIKLIQRMDSPLLSSQIKAFDKNVAGILYKTLGDISVSTASDNEFWIFMNVILLPELALYRWRTAGKEINHERFTNPLRNYLGNMWLRIKLFYDAEDIDPWRVFDNLSEDNFVAILERPKLRGYQYLPLLIGRVILDYKDNGFPANKIQDLVRKAIIDLRIQALAIDFNAFSKKELEEFVHATFEDIVKGYFS